MALREIPTLDAGLIATFAYASTSPIGTIYRAKNAAFNATFFTSPSAMPSPTSLIS